MLEVKGQGHNLVQVYCGEGIHIDAGHRSPTSRIQELSKFWDKRPGRITVNSEDTTMRIHAQKASY